MKTALITGCNGGLGRALLDKFSLEGYNIVACYYPHDDIFIGECHNISKERGVEIDHIPFDLTNKAELENGCKQIENNKRAIDEIGRAHV